MEISSSFCFSSLVRERLLPLPVGLSSRTCTIVLALFGCMTGEPVYCWLIEVVAYHLKFVDVQLIVVVVPEHS